VSEGGKPLEGEGVKPDVEVKLTRAALLAGHDAVVDAAVDWIGKAGR
jgi:C-terminal processing protease CtpA/Prc